MDPKLTNERIFNYCLMQTKQTFTRIKFKGGLIENLKQLNF